LFGSPAFRDVVVWVIVSIPNLLLIRRIWVRNAIKRQGEE
jgi:hypothetical protein